MIHANSSAGRETCKSANELRGIAEDALNPAVDRYREAGSSLLEISPTAGLFTLLPFGSSEQRSAGLTTRITGRDAGAVDRIGGCRSRNEARLATHQGPGSAVGQACMRQHEVNHARGDTSPDGTGSTVQAPLFRDDNPNPIWIRIYSHPTQETAQ